jgi:CheY-like chemotaxis protein
MSTTKPEIVKKIPCTLLVDDDPVSCYINSAMLSLSGLSHHVHAVNNGADALDFIEENCANDPVSPDCPNIVLLDLNMPVMDGFQFLEAFEASSSNRKSKIGVVILTSSNDPKDIEKIKNYNVLGYLNKPLSPEKLQSVLE